MPTALAQLDKDLAIYQAWCSGRRQRSIAEEYGISQPAVSQAVARARDAMPPLDRAAYLLQSVELLNLFIEIYAPDAISKDKGATRIVEKLLGRRGRYLGLETPQKVELAAAVAEVRDGHEPAEPLQVVIERILARQGRLQAGDDDA
jgi:predicted transcriptional regulator